MTEPGAKGTGTEAQVSRHHSPKQPDTIEVPYSTREWEGSSVWYR